MKCALSPTLPSSVLRSLKKFGADIRIARLKRRLTAAEFARALDIHRSTYGRLESGNPMVALGIYAKALYVLGLGTPIAALADPHRDEQGLLLDLQNLPQRVRAHKRRHFRRAAPRFEPAEERVLRIGVLAVMSGPAAPWGAVNKLCAQVTAEMYNEVGGIDISGEQFQIDVTCFDDKLAPSLAAEGARRLSEEQSVRYIIGPNVEQTFAAALPVAKRNRAMLFPYSFTRSLYSQPNVNAVLSQVAGYQAVPLIYRYLIESEGVETIAFLAPAAPEGLRQRQEASRIALSLGLKVLSESSTYTSGGEDIEAWVAPAIARKPDVLALSNVAPFDASRLIFRARDLGFDGFITTESAQDVEHLINTLGPAADRFIMVGGASTPDSRSERMNEFIRRFVQKAGSWNDEAGTKAYALEFLLATLQAAGKSALKDVDRFKSTIPNFAMVNPFSNRRSMLTYYGGRDFRQKRQIGIPLVVNTIQNNKLETLFTQQPEDILG